MEYKLTNKQLSNSFKSIMREYSELESAERSYDYYDYEKPGYVDANVVNYYEDLEEDWESDDWIFQVLANIYRTWSAIASLENIRHLDLPSIIKMNFTPSTSSAASHVWQSDNMILARFKMKISLHSHNQIRALNGIRRAPLEP